MATLALPSGSISMVRFFTRSIMGYSWLTHYYLRATGTCSPIYRCYNGKDDVITADKSECTDSGFTIEATPLGYSP